jgi:uncharacterized protein involved in copper resistance
MKKKMMEEEKPEEKPEVEVEVNSKEDSAEESDEGEMEGMDHGPDMGKMQVECDASDLLRAQEVKSDSKRYQAALDHLRQKKAAIESIDDLKAARSKSFTKKED